MRWYIHALKNYAVFNGRAPRAEWGWFIFFTVIGLCLCHIIDGYFELPGYAGFNLLGHEEAGPFAIAFSVLMIVPWIATGVRRLHDLNITGWAAVVFLLPQLHEGFKFLAFPLALMLLAKMGRPGDNFYGPDPTPGEPIHTVPLTEAQLALIDAQKTQQTVPLESRLFFAYIKAFRRVMDFSGRTTRREYWGYLAFLFLFSIPGILLGYFMDNPILNGIYFIVNLPAYLAVTSRRLNDAGELDVWKYLFWRIVALLCFILFWSHVFPAQPMKKSGIGEALFIGTVFAAYGCASWILLVACFYESSPFVNKYGPYPFREKADIPADAAMLTDKPEGETS